MLRPQQVTPQEQARQHDRQRVGAEALLVVGTLVAAGGPGLVGVALGLEDGEDERRRFAWYAAITAPILVATCLACARGVRERFHTAAGPPASAARVRAQIREATRNRPFVILVSAFVVIALGSGLPAVLITYFVTYVLRSDLLPVYLLVFLGAVVIWRLYAVWRKTGLNAYVLRKAEGVHAVIAFAVRLTGAAAIAVVAIHSLRPAWYPFLAPIEWLERPALAAVGLGLLGLSLVWVVVAQSRMGASWRIGIDDVYRTELVTGGVFGWSRNPIFLGIRVLLLGLFLALPNALSLTAWTLGDVLLQIQVRLEEEHLAGVHGEAYEAYCRRTRRWL